MKRLLFVSILVSALTGCASGAIETGATGHEASEGVQLRLKRLVNAGVSPTNYSLAKAQCWLDTAHAQRSENDRTGYVEEAVAESGRIARALEADQTSDAGYTTPLIARSTRLRPDLWAELARLRGTNPLACSARTLACAEVLLVRAGHADEQTGWRGARPYIEMAQDALPRARAEAASCIPVVGVAPPLPASPALALPVAPSNPTPAAVPVRESFVMLADTLFRFDKSARTDILPGGLAQLQELTQRLKAYPVIQSISITGHTDRLGPAAYNDRLSEARAATVKAYFEEQGVRAANFVALGLGEREPVTSGCKNHASRKAQVQCLQPDRRVKVEITGFSR